MIVLSLKYYILIEKWYIYIHAYWRKNHPFRKWNKLRRLNAYNPQQQSKHDLEIDKTLAFWSSSKNYLFIFSRWFTIAKFVTLGTLVNVWTETRLFSHESNFCFWCESQLRTENGNFDLANYLLVNTSQKKWNQGSSQNLWTKHMFYRIFQYVFN